MEGGDIEFVVEHNVLHDPVADVFPSRAHFIIPIATLLDPYANDAFTGGWKQRVVYPKMSQALLSALKSTPHGLTIVPDPADPSQSGLLADFVIKALDLVVDTMDYTNKEYFEFSMIVQWLAK
jgi:hypothetical protein